MQTVYMYQMCPIFHVIQIALHTQKSRTMNAKIYGLLADENYEEVQQELEAIRGDYEHSVCWQSLSAFTLYKLDRFEEALKWYEKLLHADSSNDNYRLSYATCLYKLGQYSDALKVASSADVKPENQQALQLLNSAIRYEMADLQGATKVLPARQSDPATLIQRGAILYKDMKYTEAREQFEAALELSTTDRLLTRYAIAICYYQERDFTNARNAVHGVIDSALSLHPELARSTGPIQRSVGNSKALEESALVETYNLKAALELKTKNMEGVQRALDDMPHRTEDELDAVTLHNKALVQIDTDPSGGFQKLHFLLLNPPFPPETFGNLLLMYCSHELYDMAADMLAQNGHLAASCLTPDRAAFIDALIVAQTSAEEAYQKLEAIETRALAGLDGIMRQMKRVQDSGDADEDAVMALVKKYDAALAEYIPVLCHKERLLYDIGNYPAVEAHLRDSPEQCAEHEAWKLNMGHVHYAAEQYDKALEYYLPIIEEHQGSLLDVPAVVLADSCVAFIMRTDNERAEELMRAIDAEEEEARFQAAGPPRFHLTIVNLVIGTLYCVKGNMQFGVSRIVKAMVPMDAKLNADTWLHVKRPLLCLLDELSKAITAVTTVLLDEIIDFLTEAETVGQAIPTVISSTDGDLLPGEEPAGRTIGEEARMFRRLFINYKLA